MATNEHTRYYAFENDGSDFKELSAEAAENYGGDGALYQNSQTLTHPAGVLPGHPLQKRTEVQ
jgi:hypothetical protein